MCILLVSSNSINYLESMIIMSKMNIFNVSCELNLRIYVTIKIIKKTKLYKSIYYESVEI